MPQGTTACAGTLAWKSDWPAAKERFAQWWRHEGLAVCLQAVRPSPRDGITKPEKPDDPMLRFTDPEYRCTMAEAQMARDDFLAEGFPYLNTAIGPGSLGTFLGATPKFSNSVWFEPCIDEPDTFGPIRFDPDNNRWWDVHLALIHAGLQRSQGRYLVGMPDLVENLDTLAALRGTEELLMDLIERPSWVHEKLAEINQAYFAAFDLIYQRIRDTDGGNACNWMRLWGPGKTSKVQCDIASMISAQMFDEFVVPYLTAQCEWLDYSAFHLDGEDCLQHLDSLLAIEALDAIQWIPRSCSDSVPGPGCGSPHWFDLYQRIKDAGKSLVVMSAKPDEIQPLLDAVGPEGLFFITVVPNAKGAEAVLKMIEPYR